MKTKLIAVIITIAMLSMLLSTPANAWNYGNPAKSDDLNVEYFGPRSDKLLMPLYSTAESEWEEGLQLGKIDVTDWPLDDVHYTRYTTPPWNNTITVKAYGPEFGLRLFDLNNNNNTYLGNPPDPAYPNPVFAPVGNPMAELSLRKACAYLSNRPQYRANNGPITTIEVYTVLGANSLGISPWGKYTDWDITPTGSRSDLCYLYDPTAASNVLNASGVFPFGADGWRTYKGSPLTLKIISRVDDPARDFAGTQLGLALEGAGIKIHVDVHHVDITAARTQWMLGKNAHIYTAGWSLSVDPDFVILWNWDYYWHPGSSYNTAGCNNPDYNIDSYGVQFANTQADAVYWAIKAQVDYATNVLSVPLWIAQGYKATSRTYTGGNNGAAVSPDDGENAYRGKYWQGFVNIAGFGTDNSFTFMNMHPEGFDWGNGNMTIRYGLKTPDLRQLNPIYTEWLWDNTVIDTCGYDSLLTRNPYNLAEFDPWAALTYNVSTYQNPTLGTCSKAVFTLRNDYFWTDGTPVTIADIYFTFVEMKNILSSRGLANPWWISNVAEILSFTILDPCNFEVLFDVKSVFVVGWAGGNRIMPKHIWKPICATGDPTTFAPDPNMITSGPWRLSDYTSGSHVLLVANKPFSVVQTNIAGSQPINSTQGYFRYLPVEVELHVTDPPELAYRQKLPPEDHSPLYPAPSIQVTLVSTDHNLFADRSINVYSTVDVNGTVWDTRSFVIGPKSFEYEYDIEMIVDDFYGGYSWWSYNGTYLEYNKYLFFEAENPGWNLTWHGSLIHHFPDTTVECYIVHIYKEFGPLPQLSIPTNRPFHFDLEWYQPTSPADIGGSNWYTDMSKILTLSPPGLTLPLVNPTNSWGSLANYPYRTELPTCDLKVDGKDLTALAAAFGAYPGIPKGNWNSIADINKDYKVDGKDLTIIGKNFGWPGPGED